MNEFDDILNFLEKQEKIINEKEGSHRNVENPRKSKKVDKIQPVKKVEKPIKQNESKIINPLEERVMHSGKRGFNSDKLMALMRAEIVKNGERYKKFRSKEYLSVTEIIGCPRMSYYSRKNFTEDKFIYPNLLWIQEVGKTIHKTIQKVYPFDKCEETLISKKFGVKGKYDGIENSSLVELKSLDRAKYTGTYIKDHLYQGVIYVYIMNHEYGYKIDNISIVYIMRDLKDKKPPTFNLKPNDALAEKFLNRALLIHKCLAQNKVPPVNKSEMSCQWCPYKKQCSIEDGSKNDLKKSKSKFLL